MVWATHLKRWVLPFVVNDGALAPVVATIFCLFLIMPFNTKNFLRKLVVIQCILYAIIIFSEGTFYSQLPEELQRFVTDQSVSWWKADFIYKILTVAMYVSEFMGLLLAWKFRRRAKYFLTVAAGLSFLLMAYSVPSVQASLEAALTGLASLVGDILLTLLWLPAITGEKPEELSCREAGAQAVS